MVDYQQMPDNFGQKDRERSPEERQDKYYLDLNHKLKEEKVVKSYDFCDVSKIDFDNLEELLKKYPNFTDEYNTFIGHRYIRCISDIIINTYRRYINYGGIITYNILFGNPSKNETYNDRFSKILLDTLLKQLRLIQLNPISLNKQDGSDSFDDLSVINNVIQNMHLHYSYERKDDVFENGKLERFQKDCATKNGNVGRNFHEFIKNNYNYNANIKHELLSIKNLPDLKNNKYFQDAIEIIRKDNLGNLDITTYRKAFPFYKGLIGFMKDVCILVTYTEILEQLEFDSETCPDSRIGIVYSTAVTLQVSPIIIHTLLLLMWYITQCINRRKFDLWIWCYRITYKMYDFTYSVNTLLYIAYIVMLNWSSCHNLRQIPMDVVGVVFIYSKMNEIKEKFVELISAVENDEIYNEKNEKKDSLSEKLSTCKLDCIVKNMHPVLKEFIKISSLLLILVTLCISITFEWM